MFWFLFHVEYCRNVCIKFKEKRLSFTNFLFTLNPPTPSPMADFVKKFNFSNLAKKIISCSDFVPCRSPLVMCVSTSKKNSCRSLIFLSQKCCSPPGLCKKIDFFSISPRNFFLGLIFIPCRSTLRMCVSS